ncbi:MAG: pentapeptide repeat-containing protein [Fibrobacteres bacterium]|nr:pentapeptide repeat-containing protein [Fibrobacterota bacterium]
MSSPLRSRLSALWIRRHLCAMPVFLIGSILAVGASAGGKSKSMEVDVLDTPGAFSQKYGSRWKFTLLGTIQKETWKHQRIEDWSFLSVTFKETWMDSNTFERVTFRGCTFDESKMNHSVFRNCRFIGCTFKGQRWIENSFSGGEFQNCTWRSNPISPDLPAWEHNTFDSLEMDQLTVIKRASYWNHNEFRKVKLSNFDFSQHGMVGDEFHDCEFRNGTWVRTINTTVRGLKFHDCVFFENPAEGSQFGGDFENVVFKGTNDLSAWGSFRSLQVASGGALDLDRVESSRFPGVHPYVAFDTVIDVVVDDVSKGGRFFIGKGGAKNLTVHKANLERAYLRGAVYENCLFENWEVQEFWFGKDATFRNCTFRNIHITKEVVVSGPVHFEGCTFENMRREPGVPSFLNDDPGDYLFPFESAPGVNKP